MIVINVDVFLCNWCEKVFPSKVDLFQHFLIIHQDKLLSGEDYDVRKQTPHSEKLQQEIEDLEKKVLGFTQETFQVATVSLCPVPKSREAYTVTV